MDLKLLVKASAFGKRGWLGLFGLEQRVCISVAWFNCSCCLQYDSFSFLFRGSIILVHPFLSLKRICAAESMTDLEPVYPARSRKK